MSEFPVIETERLLLRALQPSDAPTILAIHGNRDAMKYFGSDPLHTLEEATARIQAFAGLRDLPNPGVRWGLECKADQTLIGTCGLFTWNRDWKKCATGYELAPAYRGQGFMTEALYAVFEWGFDAMALNRIEAQVHPENTASLKLLGALGFEREGLLRQVAYWDQRHHDLIQLGLLRSERQSCAAATLNP